MPVLQYTSKKDELWKEHKYLRFNPAIMYELFGTLQRELKPSCFNVSKKWSYGEVEIIRKWCNNPWDKLVISNLCAITGRSPYTVFNCFLSILWDDVEKGDYKLAERTIEQKQSI